MSSEHSAVFPSAQEHSPRPLRWLHLVRFEYRDAGPCGKEVLTCVLRDGNVQMTGDPGLQETLQQGISRTVHEHIFPKDGQRFLEALQEVFTHPSLFATPIQEGVEIQPYQAPAMQEVQSFEDASS